MNLRIDSDWGKPIEIPPTPTLTYIPDLQILIMYGKQQQKQTFAVDKKKKFNFKNDQSVPAATSSIYILDLLKKEWLRKEVKGKMPSARHNHHAVYIKPCLIVYGGNTLGNPIKHLNDLYALNTIGWQWKKLFSLQNPSIMQEVSMVVLDSFRIVVMSNEVWMVVLKDVKWQLASNELPGAVWHRIITNGIPEQINASARINEDQIIIFGQNECKCINIASKTIKQVQYNLPLITKQDLVSSMGNNMLTILTQDSIYQAQLLDHKFNVLEGNLLSEIKQIHKQWRCKSILIECEDKNSMQMFLLVDKSVVCLKFQMDQEMSENTARQIVATNRIENDCIIEESIEESRLQSTKNAQQISQRYCSTIQRQQSSASSLENSQVNRNEESQEGQIEANLEKVLAYEHLKRKILESKSKMLQDYIKKAQSMVLSLCKYSEQENKQLHIERVKVLKEKLEKVWSKEVYIRKQIQSWNNRIQIKPFVLQHIDPSFYDYFV